MPSHNHSNKHLPTQAELDWAKEQMKHVLFGVRLNYKLAKAGLCPKFICQMTDKEHGQYSEFIKAMLSKN